MKIVILGAGQVGSTLVETLTAEGHDVTAVDKDAEKLQTLQDRLDIRTVAGHASYPYILRQAGIDDADMLVAVTDDDEVNMVACQVGYSLFKVPTKIARVRSPHYFIRKELFGDANLPIDIFISPEQLVIGYVKELIDHPGALQVLNFAHGKVKLVAVKVYSGGFLVDKNLAALKQYMPEVETRVAAIFRGVCSIPLDGSTVIEANDEVFFIAASEDIRVVMSALGRFDKPYQYIMIAGGGNIGSGLARTLENDYQVKVIDHNREHCEALASTLANSTVLCGDVSDKELLVNENIESMDVFCAVTNDDEVNIMSCLLAKRLGVRQVMALITRTAYVDIIEGGDIDIAISPQQATISSILTYISRGAVLDVHSLRHGAAEAIEAVAYGNQQSSQIVGRSLDQIKLPKGTTIGAIVRDDQVIIPHHDTMIESNDHVILFIADKKYFRYVEKMFHTNLTA